MVLSGRTADKHFPADTARLRFFRPETMMDIALMFNLSV